MASSASIPVVGVVRLRFHENWKAVAQFGEHASPELVPEPDSPSEEQLVEPVDEPVDEPADEVSPPVRKKIEDIDVEELRRHRR